MIIDPEKIKTPVFFDRNSNTMFDADGEQICLAMPNVGQQIVDAINAVYPTSEDDQCNVNPVPVEVCFSRNYK